jgi:hypothetical protein
MDMAPTVDAPMQNCDIARLIEFDQQLSLRRRCDRCRDDLNLRIEPAKPMVTGASGAASTILHPAALYPTAGVSVDDRISEP